MQHTFTSGRTAEIRDALPMHVVIRHAVSRGEEDILLRLQEMQNGDLKDPGAALRLQDGIVRAMWVSPRVIAPELIPGDGEISIDDLTDEELAETMDLALGGVADAAGFPDGPDGGRGDRGGKDVGSKPKQRARAPQGKR